MDTLVKGREKRSNAGSKMSSLLEAEEEDEFYKTTYGGFNEEEDDREYESEVSESDLEDSDIDIDEDDEVRSDLDDDEPKKRKRGGVSTKAYKEPAVKKPKPSEPKKAKTEKTKSKPPPSIQIYQSSPGKKALRKSTADRSKEREEREKERQLKAKMLKEIATQKRVAEVRRLTQEELLEEAKITEELNMQSLENYQRLELEKKTRRSVKQGQKGPIIRYHSLSMPLIEELEEEDDESTMKEPIDTGEKCERTFITFTDERLVKDYFTEKRCKPPVKQFCPVTRLQAKYFDPITQTPYASLQAFKIIREAYAQQLQNESSKRSKSITSDSTELTVK
ncbi:Vacuolar protein sorting-associated protein 72 [Mactra antiquata]